MDSTHRAIGLSWIGWGIGVAATAFILKGDPVAFVTVVTISAVALLVIVKELLDRAKSAG